jgi:hypothetical protein
MIRFATENTTNRYGFVTELILERRTYIKASALSFISLCDHISLASFFPFFLSTCTTFFLLYIRHPLGGVGFSLVVTERGCH